MVILPNQIQGRLLCDQPESRAQCEPPRLLATIADQTMGVNGTQTLDLSTVFTDEETLTFTVSSSDDGIVSVSVTNEDLTITTESLGSATITVIANDGNGGETSDSFTVTVLTNAPPRFDAIADQTLAVGSTQMIDLSTVFADEQVLKFTGSSSDEGIVPVSVIGVDLTITAQSLGSATITLIANDGNGEETSGNFTVTVVANLPPRLLAAIADQTLEVGGTQMIDLSTVFTDEDDLTFTASSGDDAIVSVSVTGMGLTITAVSEGVATIMVIANDGTVETSSDFTVTVDANEPPIVANAIGDQDLDVGFGTKVVDVSWCIFRRRSIYIGDYSGVFCTWSSDCCFG